MNRGFWSPLLDWLTEHEVGSERFRVALAVASGGPPGPLEAVVRELEAEREVENARYRAEREAAQAAERAREAVEFDAALNGSPPARVAALLAGSGYAGSVQRRGDMQV